MAKIKLIGAWRGHAAGAEIECTDAEARRAIAAGVAVPVKEARETATRKPRETR